MKYEVKGVADHFGGLRPWILERSDFFKGPQRPLGAGAKQLHFLRGPKAPWAPRCLAKFGMLAMPNLRFGRRFLRFGVMFFTYQYQHPWA